MRPNVPGMDDETFRRMWYAHGGAGGPKPIRPLDQSQWQPGMPAHWQEETRFMAFKRIAMRIASFFQMFFGIAYLQYRARFTVGYFPKSQHPLRFTYQVIFLCLEALSLFSVVFRIVEVWAVRRRNSVDFKRIPNHLIAPHFKHSTAARVPPQYCNYPSIGVYIPCYNESVQLVAQTVIASLNLDYPHQLLNVYLCDDGKDPHKRAMISRLRKQYSNVYYIVRPQHSYAKAGNLNYAISRTDCHLVATLDADFVPRPFMLQRFVSYFFVWNPTLGMYEFNRTLASVQAPQHFRNLSPYDTDATDQRSTFYSDVVMAGKDHFNGSGLIGTTNVMSREIMKACDFFPIFTITEDSALAIRFHSLGFRTYYVNESLATGLATTSLWSNFRQRARWLRGDWQILLSRQGPLTKKNLTFVQRFLYLNMTWSRFMSLVHIMYDLAAVLLLVGGFAPIDVPNPKIFLAYMVTYHMFAYIYRFIVNMGSCGYEKSGAGVVAFETMFRYSTVKGILAVIFCGNKLKFKVTDKSKDTGPSTEPIDPHDDDNSQQDHLDDERFGSQRRHEVPGEVAVTINSGDSPNRGATGEVAEDEVQSGESYSISAPAPVALDISAIGRGEDRGHAASTTDQSDLSSDDENERSYKKRVRMRTAEERAEWRQDIRKNLKRVHFNAFMAAALVFSIVWGVINPPEHTAASVVYTVDGVKGRYIFGNLFPLGLALGFAVSNVLPHVLAIYLCFVPYTQGWMMSDLKYGRCDQWAIHPKTGKYFVPFSFITLLSIGQFVIIVGALVVVTVLSFYEKPKFVPLTDS